MQPVHGRRIIAWFVTVVIAPPIFMALLVLTTLGMEAAQEWPRHTTWTSFKYVLRDLPQFLVLAIALALLPTLILGVPASIALHRMNVHSIVIFAAAGLILGAIGGACIIAVLAALDPNVFATPVNAIVTLAAYGALAAVTYNLVERRTARMA
jgi:hypothetical protein